MPTAVNRSFVVYKLLVPQGTRESHFDHWEKTWEMLAGIMDEDYSMSTEVQKTFAAGYSSPLIFGRYEQAVARFHENCDRELSAAHSS
jgi:hypothetical protein